MQPPFSLSIARCWWLLLLLGNQLHAEPIVSTANPSSWLIKQHYTDLIEVFGRQVPLPAGDWVLAGVGSDPLLGQPTRAYGIMATWVLFKLDAKAVVAFTLIHANAIALDGGWGISRDCQRNDLAFAKIYENSEQHAFCAFIRPLIIPPKANAKDLPAWHKAVNLAQQQGWYIPTEWREAGLRVCDWHDVLDIRYAFAINSLTTHKRQSKTSEAEETPEAVLTRWLDTMLPRVYLGFKRSLTGQPAPSMPGTEPKPVVQGEWASQAEQQNLSNSAFSLWKVAINRIVNIATSLGIDYLFIGNIYLVAGLQITSSTFHGGVDYAEELLWNTYGPQRLHQANTYDFTYVGSEH